MNVHAAAAFARIHAHGEIDAACLQLVEDLARRRDGQEKIELRMRRPEGAEMIREVTDRRSVDHPDPQTTRPAPLGALGPGGKVTGEGDDLAGMSEHLGCGRAQNPPSTFSIEKRYADAAFEFCQTLRQRRWADADRPRCSGPARVIRNCDEILQLSNREIRQSRRHRATLPLAEQFRLP